MSGACPHRYQESSWPGRNESEAHAELGGPPGELELRMHAELGVGAREMAFRGPLADDQRGGDGGRALPCHREGDDLALALAEHLLMVEFASCELGMENSARSE